MLEKDSEALEHSIRTGEICPYCHGKSEYDETGEFAKYVCKPCNARVGVHHSGKPLGRLANKELRRLKITAHYYFDNLWRQKIQKAKIPKRKARSMAYKWLSEAMGLPPEYTHIGMMDNEECKRVIELCKPYFKKKK